jgi:hypothetical protein
MFRTASLLALALGVVAIAPPAHAQSYYYGPPTTVVRPRPQWWYAGVGLVGTSIIDQSGGPEQLHSGGGISAWIGVNVARQLSLELGWLGSFHNPATVDTWAGPETDFLVLSGVTADAKIHLGRPNRVDPYLQGGVGMYFLGSQHVGLADSVGPGYQLGGGIDFRVNPIVSLGVRGLYRGMSMGPPNGEVNDTFIHALTFEGSVALHF